MLSVLMSQVPLLKRYWDTEVRQHTVFAMYSDKTFFRILHVLVDFFNLNNYFDLFMADVTICVALDDF